jgi:type IX secretion system PorP/SprF family membrane protein
MKKNTTLFLLFISFGHLLSQQLPQFSLRTYDLMNYNPAVVGSHLNTEILLHHRSQWVGFENAPKSDNLSFSTLINKTGLGGSVYYDNEVTAKNFGANLIYAYHIFCNRFNISLGSNFGIQQYQFNTSLMKPYDGNDPLLTGLGFQTKLIPNVGGGILLHSWKYYFGSSFSYYLPLQNSNSIDSKSTSIFYSAMGGYNFHLSENLVLLTSAFVAGQSYSNIQYDFGIRGLLMDIFSLGASYRPDDAISLSTSIKINKSILIAYSYDIIISKLKNYNSGSHEVVVSYEFNNSNRKYSKNKNGMRKKMNNNDIIF